MRQGLVRTTEDTISLGRASDALPPRRRAAARAVLAPSLRIRGALRLRVATAVVALGLFTLSWERLANVSAGPYNVKLAVLLLTIAAVLLVDRWFAKLRALLAGSGRARWLLIALGATLLFFVVRAVFTQPVTLAIAQVAAVITGAVLPALAVLGALGTLSDAAWALRWLIAGAVVASLFGLYQLLAFYTGLPQGIDYTGVGTSGAGGRIPAFSYEPAYFAYFLILAIGAVLALARLEERRVRWVTLAFFAFVLALVNVRALLFVIPVAALLLAVDWRSNRNALGRALLAGAAGALLAIAVPIGGVALVDALQPPADAPTPSKHEPVADPPRDDAESVPRDNAPAAPQLPTDVLDPNEVSSNGPRLDLYKAVLQVDLENPLVGVGPGALRPALAENGYIAPNQGVNVVANNVWLQAGADGGIPLVLLELAVLIGVVLLWWKARRSPEQPLLATWLAVLLVGGMLTSYFFDIKIWVVLALLLCVRAAKPATPAPAD